MQPTFFINHGGGPCFFLDPGPMRATWHELEDYLRGFLTGRADEKAEAFDVWLREAMVNGRTRDGALILWEDAPGARDAQPHEDHLLPLMVAAGAAPGEPGIVDFHGHALGKAISGFRFG